MSDDHQDPNRSHVVWEGIGTMEVQAFTYPFQIRLGKPVLDVARLVNGLAYTTGQIQQMLIDRGWIELAGYPLAFDWVEANRTVVVWYKGPTFFGRRRHP